MQLDQRFSFGAHASMVVKKTDAAIKSLRAIMPNIGGSRHHSRKLLASVPTSMMLYGTPIWYKTMSAGGMRALRQCQRRITLRVVTFYRTVSSDVFLVLAGISLIDLLAAERADLYEGKRAGRDATTVKGRSQEQSAYGVATKVARLR